MVAGNDDRATDALREADEGSRSLELPGAGPLREVAGDGDDVELFFLHDGLDRLDLLGDRGLPEVQVGDVEDTRHRNLAMTALLNSSVVAVPPRSPVSVLPSRIVEYIASRMRVARAWSPR